MGYLSLSISKKIEDKIDAFLYQNGISMKSEGYRFLKEVIVLAYLYPGMKFKEIYTYLAETRNVSIHTIYASINRLAKGVKDENGEGMAVKELVYICINTIHSFSESD